MKDYKRIAVWALQIIGFFFAAFGGFLIKIAPPDQTGALQSHMSAHVPA